MSSTRYAAPGSEFSPHSLASSPEYSYGLNGCLVAKRTSLLRNAEDRELIWFFQELSHRTGLHTHQVANYFSVWPWETPGFEGGGLERVVADLNHFYGEVKREVKVDYQKQLAIFAGSEAEYFDETKAETSPVTLNDLQDICLDGEISAKCGFFQCTAPILKQYKAKFELIALSNFVQTTVSKQVHRALEYALKQRCMVLIEGNSRIGKSHSAQVWAQGNLGKVRYVQLQASNDEMSFFSCIAHALGLPNTRNYKALELKAKVLQILKGGDLLLILDEADHLWPRTDRPRLAPARIDWINTALVNNGVPVALIGTPKFSLQVALYDKKCPSWAAEQFIGRLGDHIVLPSELPYEDLESIAKGLLPEVQDVTPLVKLAQAEEAYVATLERFARKARFIASEKNQPLTNKLLFMICDEELRAREPVLKPSKRIARSSANKPQNEAESRQERPSKNLFSEASKVGNSRKAATNILSSSQILASDSPNRDSQELSLLP